MWDTAADALRRWSILLIGLVLIVGGFLLATLLSAQNSRPAQLTSRPQTSTSDSRQVAQQNAPLPDASRSPSPTTKALSPAEPAPSQEQNAAPPAAQQSAQQAPATQSAAQAPKANDVHDHTAQADSDVPGSSGQAVARAANAATSSVNGGDPAAGRLVFRKCQACHSLEQGKNMLGPSLAGIIGPQGG
jgi:nitrite reductase (NO-forming)